MSRASTPGDGSPVPAGHPAGIPLPDGRTLAYAEYGAADGLPLIVLHGFPGCRLQAGLLDEQARHHGLRLIAPDRPGFGGSTPHAGRRIADFAGDVARLADALGAQRFGVLGISCGGAYALACAQLLGDRLSYAGLLAGMGPLDMPATRDRQLPVLRLLFALARRQPRLADPLLLLDQWMFRSRPEQALRSLARILAPPDRRVLEESPRTARVYARSLAEAYAQGIAGPRWEAHLIASRRDHALETIRLPVHLYQGGLDQHVPPAMARAMARRLPRVTLREYPDDGHLSIVLNQFPQCAADFRAAHVAHARGMTPR